MTAPILEDEKNNFPLLSPDEVRTARQIGQYYNIGLKSVVAVVPATSRTLALA
jgi:hypothetical protein